MKKEKLFVYTLMSFFTLTVALFAAVLFYSDYYFPDRFQKEVCQSFQRGESISASELIAYLKSKKVEDQQIYVRENETGRLSSLGTETAGELIAQADRGVWIQVVSILGHLRKTSCEISLEHQLIQ